MSISSPHNEGQPSSVAGVSDTGNFQGAEGHVAAAKRQGYLNDGAQTYNDMAFLAMVQAINEQTLLNLTRAADAQNHRDGQVTSDGVSQTGVNLYYGQENLVAARADNQNDPNLLAHLTREAA